MSSAEALYHKKLHLLKYFLKESEYYSTNQYIRRTTAHKWNMGELYNNMMHGSYSFYIDAIYKCIEQKTGLGQGKKTFSANLLFTFNVEIPEINIDIPGYKPQQPKEASTVVNDMYHFIKELNKVAQAIDKSSSTFKVAHPQYGMLTATEWYQLLFKVLDKHKDVKLKLDSLLKKVERLDKVEFHD